MVVQNGPHYTMWSPDGRNLTFVVADVNGLLVYLVPMDDLLVPQVLIDRAPVYMDWDQESSNLFIHRQIELFHYRLSDRQMTPVDERSGLYRVPAISPAGDRIAFLTERDGVMTLVVRAMATGEEERLASVLRETAFIWSPIEQYIAMASRSADVPTFYDGLDLLNIDTGERQRLLDGLVLSFFWSPNGERLGVVRGLPDSLSFEWTVVEPASGEARRLTTFPPFHRYAEPPELLRPVQHLSLAVGRRLHAPRLCRPSALARGYQLHRHDQRLRPGHVQR